MYEFLEKHALWALLWTTVCAILVAIGWFVVGKIRAESAQHEPAASDLLSKFRELHARGELSDAEFREIKTALGARLQEELNSSRETP